MSSAGPGRLDPPPLKKNVRFISGAFPDSVWGPVTHQNGLQQKQTQFWGSFHELWSSVPRMQPANSKP